MVYLCMYTYTWVCAQLLSPVRLFCDPVDCSPPGSSVHGISQGRILEQVAISFSRGSSTEIPIIFFKKKKKSLPTEHREFGIVTQKVQQRGGVAHGKEPYSGVRLPGIPTGLATYYLCDHRQSFCTSLSSSKNRTNNRICTRGRCED